MNYGMVPLKKYGVSIVVKCQTLSDSTITCNGDGHSLYGTAFVVDLSKDINVFSADIRRSNGSIRAGSFRVNCLNRHSNWRAACQVGNPSTWQTRSHVSPLST